MYAASIDRIVAEHGAQQGSLIAILEAIQRKYSYLPEEALRLVASRTDTSLVDIYGVATFYKSFSLKPRGKHLVSVCKGTACHVRGAPSVASEFERQLGVAPGETTTDREFTFDVVNCLGACALGPIVVIDGHYFSNVNRAEVSSILARARDGLDEVEVKTDERVFPLSVACPRCNHGLVDTDVLVDGHPSIRVVFFYPPRNHGSLRVSCLYGSRSVRSDHPIPIGEVLNLFCPHCHGELASTSECATCGAPMVPMIVRGGGMLKICARRGCPEHSLDVTGINL